ncbi:MAG: hypothetical protein HY286_16875 [Planctomycetes bacterium]|nr:hypothetical protein [Planctomycetota bacterium]
MPTNLFITLPLLILQSSIPSSAPAAESAAQRVDEGLKRLAREHDGIAQFAAGKKLYLQAWQEYLRAARMDPRDAEASRGIADYHDKRDGGDLEERMAGIAEVNKKRKATSAKAIVELKSLAESAAAAGAAPAAKRAWGFLLDYDSDSAQANAGVGKVKKGSTWVDASEESLEDAALRCLRTAAAGEEWSGTHFLDTCLGIELTKVKSEHYEFFGSFEAAELKKLTKIAEGGRAFVIESLGLAESDITNPVAAVLLTSKDLHGKFIDHCTSYPEGEKRAIKGLGGAWIDSPFGIEDWGREGRAEAFKDTVAHRLAGHVTLRGIAGKDRAPDWLEEGFSYWLSLKLTQSALTYCISFESGTGMSKYHEKKNWKELARALVREGRDTPIKQIIQLDVNRIGAEQMVKGWSIVDYLIRERRAEFVAFLKDLRTMECGPALLKDLKVSSLEELDYLWREFVREKY